MSVHIDVTLWSSQPALKDAAGLQIQHEVADLKLLNESGYIIDTNQTLFAILVFLNTSTKNRRITIIFRGPPKDDVYKFYKLPKQLTYKSPCKLHVSSSH